MINTIIFSKDKASQLRLLLESIKKNANNTFNINVLYSCSNNDFKAGYIKLRAENILNNINWVEVNDFKKQTLELLTSNYEYSCFLMDDDIIYKEFNSTEIISVLKNDMEVFCFSLRLGKNTINVYSMNAKNVIILSSEEGNIIKWDWSKHYMDFGFPLSLHGHIFRTKEILKLTNNVRFNNPSSLEEALQIYDNYPKEKMASFKTNIAINGYIGFDNQNENETNLLLNTSYLEEKKINIELINFNNIDSCEPKLKLRME